MSLTVSVRIEGKKSGASGGQKSHDMREGKQPEYVDAKRSNQNSVLIEPMTSSQLKKLCEERRAEAGAKRKMRSNASVSQVGIITFGTQAQKVIESLRPAEQDRLLRNAAETAAKHCKNELIGLVVHRDESAIHAHFQMPSICKDGKPQSKKGVDFSKLQDQVATSFFHLSITRGTKKSVRIERGEPESAYIHRNVKQLHEDLPKEIKAAERRLSGVLASSPNISIKPVTAEIITKRTWWKTKIRRISVYAASQVDNALKEAAAKTENTSKMQVSMERTNNELARERAVSSNLRKRLKLINGKFNDVLRVLAYGDKEQVDAIRENARDALKPPQRAETKDRGISR